ncbi:unnamed protein product [Cochlearia groenlandica]
MITDFDSHDVEETPYCSSSRMELKRRHTEPSFSELFGNKRQMVEIDTHLSSWDNPLVPTQLNDCLSGPVTAHTSDLLGRYISPLGYQDIEEHCNDVSSAGLPVVHTVCGNSFSYDTIRKVKLNGMYESSNVPESMARLYGEGVSGSFETCLADTSGQDRTLLFGQTCSNIDKISCNLPEDFATKLHGNFIRNFDNEGVGLVPMGGIYGKGDGNVLSTFHPFEKGVENFLWRGQSLQNPECNIFSTSTSYNKEQENFMSLLSYGKVPENLFMTESNYHKEKANASSVEQSPYTEGGGEMASLVSGQDREEQNNDRINHLDRSKNIFFGDYQKETTMDSSICAVNNYENPTHAPATAKDPLHIVAEENISFEFRNPSHAIPRVDTFLVPKSKDPKTAKKVSTNTFPSNVKSLLSTGMFDGVTVKYYSWSREKNLKGIIKGTGYLCGCSNCNLNKVLNAYEFEQHANCKTKHPNNHIYFENGKTIYGVVQELKNTPQDKLFDAIQIVTGSDINQKNFNTWKASYQVASLELQRIYGKDAVTFAS